MFQKLLHKKWMVVCLLIGNILLISVAISHPMYRASSFQRMLTDEFDTYKDEKFEWPATFFVSYMKGQKVEGLSYDAVNDFVNQSTEQLGVEIAQSINFYTLGETKMTQVVVRDKGTARRMKLSAMTDLFNHVEIVQGRLPVDGKNENGSIEVIASEDALLLMDLLIDEEYVTETLTDIDGNPIKIKVVGAFRPIDTNDDFWVMNPSKWLKELFVTPSTFHDNFMATPEMNYKYSIKENWFKMWDYKTIKPSDVKHIIVETQRIVNTETYGKLVQSNDYEGILTEYSGKAKRVEASLLILQIPAMILLCAFLYMISGQMLNMEQNEISLMKSRGAKRWQVLSLYFMQSVFLGLISLVVALPCGRFMCSVLGSASNFMEFSSTRVLEVKYTTDIVLYAFGALLVSILMTIIPVISYSKVSIVNLKQSRSRRKRSIWKTSCLDLICLAVSLYGFYNFSNNQGNVIETVLAGKSLDPLLYFSSALFILGAGLVCLRIQPFFIKILLKFKEKSLKPAAYASFLETVRSGKKQEFIMIFMILTVALGIYNMTVARTIVTNAEKNVEYVTGADIIVKEQWKDNSAMVEHFPDMEFVYYEPDFGKFNVIEGITDAAKVINRKYTIAAGSKQVPGTVMGIYAKDFANVTSMDDSLLRYDYYDYLNVLATSENACVVSENFMIQQGLKLGDLISFKDSRGGKVSCRIYGFFSYWPSYQPKTYSLNQDSTVKVEDNYLVVTNLAYLNKSWNLTPYEVWIKTDGNTVPLYQYIEDNPSMKITKFLDMAEEKENIRSDTLFQGTNGILTMSFVIVLILCAAGYLIYWIMSIRSRELLFGILRAMGMRKSEITWMLVIEQICCGLYSIAAGTVVGLIAAQLYVPLIQGAYAASDQVLPLELITSSGDLFKLFGVIFIVVIICLITIGRIVSKMNISNALKLGED